MKKFMLLIAWVISFTLLFSIPIFAFESLGDLTYWYSDENYLYRYKSQPVVAYSIGDSSGFEISDAYNYATHARTQWSNTANMTSNYASTTNYADIIIFYGSYSQVANRIPGFVTSNDDEDVAKGGRTVFPNGFTFEGSFWHSSGHKECSEITSSLIGVAYSPSLPSGISNYDILYKNIVTHEFGHALGWIGHSANSLHIMNPVSSSITSVNIMEAQHIKQVKAY